MQLVQYLQRQQHLMPPEAKYNAVQILYMGSGNIFLHSAIQPWKNKVSMK